VAMQAGHAMLRKIQRENPYPHLASMGECLVGGLQKLANQHLPFPVSIASFGSISWMVCGETGPVRRIESIPAEQKANYAKIFHALLDEGVYFAPSGYEVGFLSTAHTGKDLDFTMAAAEKAFKKVRG
jgi:glutamate-1-semialdehyde 2,1-aminomutase